MKVLVQNVTFFFFALHLFKLKVLVLFKKEWLAQLTTCKVTGCLHLSMTRWMSSSRGSLAKFHSLVKHV